MPLPETSPMREAQPPPADDEVVEGVPADLPGGRDPPGDLPGPEPQGPRRARAASGCRAPDRVRARGAFGPPPRSRFFSSASTRSRACSMTPAELPATIESSSMSSSVQRRPGAACVTASRPVMRFSTRSGTASRARTRVSKPPQPREALIGEQVGRGDGAAAVQQAAGHADRHGPAARSPRRAAATAGGRWSGTWSGRLR